MKSKWFALTRPQQVLLLLQAALILMFAVLYSTVGRQKVIWYNGAPLQQHKSGTVTTYSGKLDGQAVSFTVSPGPVVEYRLGGTLYGPYSISFDSSAVSSELDASIYTGVEVRDGGEVLFRGAYSDEPGTFLLFTEGDSMSPSIRFVEMTTSNSAPSVYWILQIAIAPEVVQRGSWSGFWTGVFVCVMCAISILYADALFRLRLAFRVRNAEDAEPSDWELSARWISWGGLTICAFALFLAGLTRA